MRYFFLGSSIVMAFTVLVMRLHYSIDVIGAYFITYGIFHMTAFLQEKTKNLSWIQEIENNTNVISVKQ